MKVASCDESYAVFFRLIRSYGSVVKASRCESGDMGSNLAWCRLWRSRAESVLTLNMNIWLPLLWSTWSWARGPDSATCAGLAHGRDYSYCIASELKLQKYLAIVFPWIVEKTFKQWPTVRVFQPSSTGLLGNPGIGFGFRVQGSGFRVQGAGFRVQDSGFRVQGSGFTVQGSGFRVQGPGLELFSA